MTPEELDQPLETRSPGPSALSEPSATAAPDALPHSADLDKVSVAKDNYILKGWMVLNDGCPDCNTQLMRNQEATNQVCVNCEINPPVDPEEQDDELQLLEIESEPESPLTAIDTNNTLLSAMAMPAPTSVLPSAPAPGAYRPLSPTNHRISVLDPAMEGVRKAAFRSPSGRIIGGHAPPPLTAPPLTAPPPPTAADFPRPPPPPRSSTPLPSPPRTAPPPKAISGPLGHNLAFPRPPGPPPPANPLASPPFSPLAPKLNPRDKRRSPQSSVVMQGNILPPSSPPPRRPTLPTPPSSSAIIPGLGPESDAHTSLQNAEVTAEIMHESTGRDGKGSDVDTARYHTALISTQSAEGEDEKDLESHDEFEDAAEEMVQRFSDQESKQNDARKEQNEKASRLMGEKMLQGWTMLQEPCPNAGCYGVPLMRSREKKEFCVVCETYYQRDQDQEHGKYSIATSTASAAAKPNGNAPSPISSTASRFPAPPTTLPPAPRSPTTASASTSPQFRATSPLSSPGQSRVPAALQGRISSSIILPPPASMSPSFGMTSQQILHRATSEDMDKLASEDEETKRHLQMIGKVGEFAAKSLPPVPPVPVASAPSASRPTSTYSSSSGYNSSDRERSQRHHTQNGSAPHSSHPEQNARIPAPSVPLTPEVQAIVTATHKTMATLLTKLELYRLALEVSENRKECHALANQIKGIMECLRVCREVL